MQSICTWATAFIKYAFLTSPNFKLILRHAQSRTALWVIRRLKQGEDIPFIQSMKGVKMQLHSALVHNICAVLSVSTCTQHNTDSFSLCTQHVARLHSVTCHVSITTVLQHVSVSLGLIFSDVFQIPFLALSVHFQQERLYPPLSIPTQMLD